MEGGDFMTVTKASVFDVSVYILEKCGQMSTMKLQKLVYYSQAWSLVWDEEPLFDEAIQAWINGPVVPILFESHKGRYRVNAHFLARRGNSDNLSKIQKETIDSVLDFYGDKNSQWLIDLTHKEDPWVNARRGLDSSDSSNAPITLKSIANYYGSL